LRLTQETFDRTFATRHFEIDELDGNRALQDLMLRSPNTTEATSSEAVDEQVLIGEYPSGYG
jgi:hypothetical protein